ncbi:MAG: tRNA lysidine(34) synthetase TilS [Chitinophagaceae bacterium]|nr:tRNA lysidine(34) synthetase TilS [Chitinophagaceae bacterium]
MDLLKEFQQYIKQQHLFLQKDKLLLAVSGGVDSVILCELCKQAGYDFIIAHCNFQLRGAESERDEKFVQELGKKYNVEILIKKFDTSTYASEKKLSIQVAARQLRYKWFDEILNNRQLAKEPAPPGSNFPLPVALWLLTAHHANDNIETLLMNFFKGTGIYGLHGILPKQGKIKRPLLFAKKEELLQFANENQLDFVEDSSNASEKYTRNYFRNRLIPDLQKVFPQVEENLLHNIERFREMEMLYDQSIQLLKKKLLEPKGNEMHIPVLKLVKAEPLHSIVYEIIKAYGFTAQQTDEVIALLKSETGKYIRSATHRVIKNRNWLIISPNETAEAQHILIEGEGSLQFAVGSLQVKKIINDQLSIINAQRPADDQLTAQLDASFISFPLLLRKWKPGDYFYPLGMQKKKKLSRFFIDQKLSLTQKERTWVIEMDKKIIWVVGLRIDDRFKLRDTTKDILQISLSVAQ